MPWIDQHGHIHLDNMDSSPDYAKMNKEVQQKQEPGTKFDFGKPPLDLISVEAQIQEAMVLDFGRKKYNAHNWRKDIMVQSDWGCPSSH
jgi:Domain of unknown function (DUF5664)